MGFSKMMELLQKKNKGRIVLCNVGKDAILLDELLDLKLSCFKIEMCKAVAKLYEKEKNKLIFIKSNNFYFLILYKT